MEAHDMDLVPAHVPVDRSLQVLAVCSGGGAGDPRCREGPLRLRRMGFLRALERMGLRLSWTEIPEPVLAQGAAGENVIAVNRVLARCSASAVARGQRFLVLGGDHSCAIGTWSGVAAALDERTPLGLLWIDAHMDSHRPHTSPTGNLHGMPLACLLGYGDTPCGGAGVLRPERVCLIGVRSFEPEEARLLEALRVRVYLMEELHRRGLAAVMGEALGRVAGSQGRFGLTLDLDAVDPRDAPGVGSPVPGGIQGAELLRVLAGIGTRDGFLGLEIAEYNPSLDRGLRTAGLVTNLARAVFEAGGHIMTNPLELEGRYCAHNYHPLPVTLVRGRGVYVWDDQGRRYLDMMSAYSAVSHGHGHPRLLRALHDQARTLAVVSRAFHSDRLGPFLQRACELTGQDMALPMNTGAEAVETALKACRKWAYRVKGVAEGRAEIIACEGNFHGRTLAIVAMSSEPQYQEGFGPFPPGFRCIPYGDARALEAAITPHTAAFLVEPIQGEGGIVLPPAGYLKACARICRDHGVLLVCDEVQTGLGRTGALLACDHDGIRPDGLILGKALGGGLLPVSLFLACRELMEVFTPGDHGSTFGGNPLACAVGLEALNSLLEEGLIERSAQLGGYMLERLRTLDSPLVKEVRGRGLFVGIEVDGRRASARAVCEALLAEGVLSKETRDTVVRFAPPLVIERAQIDQAVAGLRRALKTLEHAA
jgi:ornithine--oxo-acid transaminase